MNAQPKPPMHHVPNQPGRTAMMMMMMMIYGRAGYSCICALSVLEVSKDGGF